MNENYRFPIVTTREGNKITKVCVEDMYKVLKRVEDSINKANDNYEQIVLSVEKDVEDANGNIFNGDFIIGTGVSQPNIEDAFDEEIGNNIAFMKAKLNANIKKRNILYRILNEYVKVLEVLDAELAPIENYIGMDLYGIRQYNPEYLKDSYGEVKIMHVTENEV